MKFLFAFSLVILCTSISLGQNMVTNPSFEEMKNCPFSMNQLKFTKAWFPFGTADPSPDLFHTCAYGNMVGIPRNIFGLQKPRTGDAYAGLIAYLTSKSGKTWKLPANHREFVMVQLTKPLIKGNSYYAEMWVNLAENCEYAVNSLGMYFTQNLPHMDWKAMELGYYKPQIQSNPDSIINNINGWTKVSGTFVAKGDELALTIGNFINDQNIQVEKTKRKFPVPKKDKVPKHLQPMMAYYFIDDVRVTPVDPSEPIYPEELLVEKGTDDEDYFGPATVGKKFILNNIQFDFDKAVILEPSFVELDKLYDYMVENVKIKIEIEGHTDNVGDEEYNYKLSTRRAKAVVDYLTKVRDVNELRIGFKGYGSSKPIVSNDTPEGQALNRRVEFVIVANR
ncbi:MAG: OmpA family protein [Cyclobacteriaceae bacterium]